MANDNQDSTPTRDADDNPQDAAAPQPAANKRLLYIADPMCSWCWGFAPVMVSIVAGYGARLPMKLLVGGLRPGTTEAMTERARDTVRHHWDQVADATGQPFDFAFFDRDSFVYDTEPACRAVVAVRGLAGQGQALGYFFAVQHAFYAENRDMTDPENLADVAEAQGHDRARFLFAFQSKDVRAETQSDFHAVQAFGIAGFPAVVLGDDDGYQGLTMGWQPFEHVREPLEVWLAR